MHFPQKNSKLGNISPFSVLHFIFAQKGKRQNRLLSRLDESLNEATYLRIGCDPYLYKHPHPTALNGRQNMNEERIF